MRTDQVGSIGLRIQIQCDHEQDTSQCLYLLICKIRISENVTELYPAQSKSVFLNQWVVNFSS